MINSSPWAIRCLIVCPVYDAGEANAEDYYGPVLQVGASRDNLNDFLSFLQEDRGFQSSVIALARKYKGLVILWEHRYYGQSLPFQDKFSSVVRPFSLFLVEVN